MRKLIFIAILIALLPTHGVHAQVAGSNTKHFEKAGLSFDYPADWKLTDSSTADVQYIVLTPEGGTAQIAVIAQLGSEKDCDFQAASKKITNALMERIADQIQAPRPLETSAIKTLVGVAEIDGVELHGLANNRRVTSDVYSLRVNLRFVNLVYLRIDDDARTQAGWKSLRTTLKVATVLSAARAYPGTPGNPNILNGRALRLAHPDYPPIARLNHVSGLVVVQVTIDELGNVASANAISGHPLLQAFSVAAAKQSKFSPTKVCGETVRVTGLITYNFVPY